MRASITFLLALISCSCAMHPCQRVTFGRLNATISGDDPLAGLNRGGIIVISDIDDTIKNTHVMFDDTRTRNLIGVAVDGLHAWRPVSGMASLYRHWKDADRASFIYVSAGPRRYYPRLKRSLEDWCFPNGPIVLREAINPLPPPDYKRRAILPIIHGAVGRHFILIGDSGEYDPECYGQLARDFPQWVDHIFIREISKETLRTPRYRCAFQGVFRKVTLFPSPNMISDPVFARN
jgi:phosphatidate phosphatase APP1